MANDLTVIFALLEFTGVKAVHKMFIKLTPAWNMQSSLTYFPLALHL